MCGIDNRGSGRSDGLFCYVESYREWVADLLQFTETLKSHSSNSSSHKSSSSRQGFDAPVFLLAPSLAGNISLHAAIEQVRPAAE